MYWPVTAAEAIAVQEELRHQVDTRDVGGTPRYVAGLDVAYDGDRLAAAVVVLDWETLAEVDRRILYVTPRFRLPETTRTADRLGRVCISQSGQ